MLQHKKQYNNLEKGGKYHVTLARRERMSK